MNLIERRIDLLRQENLILEEGVTISLSAKIIRVVDLYIDCLQVPFSDVEVLVKPFLGLYRGFVNLLVIEILRKQLIELSLAFILDNSIASISGLVLLI